VSSRLPRWIATLGAGLLVGLWPAPAGVERPQWTLLAVFVAAIVGSVLQPVPGAAVALLGVTVAATLGALPVRAALSGYADPIVWLVLAAFWMSRGMVKTGLGRRIALHFVRALGRRSLGLGYAIVASETVLATLIPSTGARCGGITFPVTRSVAEAYDSHPGPTARRLGAFLMLLLYQCEVVVCAMFLTGQASNALIARFAAGQGVPISYARWAVGALVPGLLCLAVVPLVVYRLYPPEVRHTPRAAETAAEELARMGAPARGEWLMLLVFVAVGLLWASRDAHGVDYAVVALVGIGVLLLAGVLEWEELLAERGGWDVFVWYGAFVGLADGLAKTGIMTRLADAAAAGTAGLAWPAALALLLLLYFYAAYGFASITAHATAMYVPFVVVTVAAGAPPVLAALSLAYLSNVSAGLTHYGTTSGPIIFAAGYVPQRDWWRMGLVLSLVTIPAFALLGAAWWKVLGWW
jgi:divalent anion:Na+ symporter, DASS family